MAVSKSSAKAISMPCLSAPCYMELEVHNFRYSWDFWQRSTFQELENGNKGGETVKNRKSLKVPGRSDRAIQSREFRKDTRIFYILPLFETFFRRKASLPASQGISISVRKGNPPRAGGQESLR
jgi:hypothetical protein